MAVFEWSEKYSVKVKEIDDQHKKLIKMVGDLSQAMREGKGRQMIGRVLDDLIKYTVTHFAAEERLMKQHGYPEYQEHKSKHEKMAGKVLDIQKQVEQNRLTVTTETLSFLENWVDKHILGTDMKYGPYLNSQGVN